MPHHRLVSLSVANGHHFPAADLAFADGLDVLIGGRGAGKTSIGEAPGAVGAAGGARRKAGR